MADSDFSGLDACYPKDGLLDKINPVKQVGKKLHKEGLQKTVGAAVVGLFVIWGLATFLGCASVKNAGNTLTNVSVRESYKRQARHCDPNPIYSWVVGYDNRLCELTLQEFVDKAIAAGTVKVAGEAIDEGTMDQLVQRGVKAFDANAKMLTSSSAMAPIAAGDGQLAQIK